MINEQIPRERTSKARDVSLPHPSLPFTFVGSTVRLCRSIPLKFRVASDHLSLKKREQANPVVPISPGATNCTSSTRRRKY